MEHISIPIQRVIDIMEDIYHGYDYDAAIELKLRHLWIREDQVKMIIAIPADLANDKNDKKIPDDLKHQDWGDRAYTSIRRGFPYPLSPRFILLKGNCCWKGEQCNGSWQGRARTQTTQA
jgi:hypothetical protein